MRELRRFYVHWMSSAGLVVALFAYLIPTHFLPPLIGSGSHGALVWVLEHITSRPAIVVLLWVADQVIRKHLWKILHPELNFSGRWIGYTRYTHVRMGVVEQEVPFETRQEVRIVQNCLDIRLVPSQGKDFTFRSLAIEILNDGAQLAYAYHVAYAQGVKDRPSEAYGYEWLDVVASPEGKRPHRLKGQFAQCALGQVPVFSGEVSLTRERDGAVFPSTAHRNVQA